MGIYLSLVAFICHSRALEHASLCITARSLSSFIASNLTDTHRRVHTFMITRTNTRTHTCARTSFPPPSSLFSLQKTHTSKLSVWLHIRIARASVHAYHLGFRVKVHAYRFPSSRSLLSQHRLTDPATVADPYNAPPTIELWQQARSLLRARFAEQFPAFSHTQEYTQTQNTHKHTLSSF